MDFVQGIGERYLIGKANAAPQQLENLAKKQFKSDDPAVPKAELAAQKLGKDKEIEKLRKELASAKSSLEKQGKQGKQRKPSVDTNAVKERHRDSQSVAGSASGKSAVTRHIPLTHSKPPERNHKHKPPKEAYETRRGRSDSIKTAIAARPHSADPVKFREVNYSRSGHDIHHQPEAPETRQRELQAMSTQAVASSRTDRGEQAYQQIATTVSDRARPATDLCVVEVMEEEPPRRRRTDQSRGNVIEVIERDRHRTRYVLR
ncbi:MAG: hypothetical protein Q9208_003124 [Pyrenodesmia sp. 3 TL-2023]